VQASGVFLRLRNSHHKNIYTLYLQALILCAILRYLSNKGVKLIKYFTKNTQGKDYFVGDLHGEISKLDAKLTHVAFDFGSDRLFSVGDLVDRGEDSVACAGLVIEPWFHAVQGNHENMSIRYPLGNMDTDNYRRNGGAWNIDLPKESSEGISNMLKELPYMMEIETEYGTIGVVHAEVAQGDWNNCKGVIASKDVQQQVMWNREKITYMDADCVTGIDYVVVGHTPLKKPIRLGNVFYIDTGACFGRDLTLLSTEDLLKIK
jgi:serine/threonine protein phosphatase 1